MNIFSRRCRIILSAIVLILFANHVSFAETWESGVTGVTPQNLTSVWTTSSITSPDTITTEIFCVGESGTIIYKDGSDWFVQHNTGNNLYGIWGNSPDSVFAVGIGRILHYNGTSWTQQYITANTLNDIWGNSATDIFAVGNNGTIIHCYDGSTWVSQTSGTSYNLNGVWGSSATDVYAVGENFTILHYDGSSWSEVTITNPPTTSLNAVWGYASDSVFVVGDSEVIIWFNGNTWTLLSSVISSNIDLTSVWGASACNVYAAGVINDTTGAIYHFDGSTWTSQEDLIDPADPSPLLGMHGTSMRDIFAVGNGGTFISHTLTEDEVYPLICGTSPVADTTDIAIDASIMALFSTEMDPDTITASTFTLSDGSSSISGTISYESGAFAVFTPDDNLDYETTYTARLGMDIEDRFGYGIGYDEDYTWSFTTTAEASSSSSSSGGCFISVARSRQGVFSRPERF